MGKIFQMYEKLYDLILHRLEILYLEDENEDFMSRRWEGNVVKNVAETGRETEGNFVKNVAETGTVLGNDSGKDIDEFAGAGNGEFGGYADASSRFGFLQVSKMGKGRVSNKRE